MFRELSAGSEHLFSLPCTAANMTLSHLSLMHTKSRATQVHLYHSALPGSWNNSLQPFPSERNLGQAAVFFCFHKSWLTFSLPATVPNLHSGSAFSILTTVPLRISGHQHPFILNLSFFFILNISPLCTLTLVWYVIVQYKSAEFYCKGKKS